MFVAMIIQAYKPYPYIGGAERQLANLARRMVARGLRVHILTRRYPGLNSFELVDGIPVHRLPAPGPKALASILFTISAQPLLWRLKPDIIHAHELLSPTTTAVAAKRLIGTPVVVKVLGGGDLGDIARMKNRLGGPERLRAFRRDVDVFISVSSDIDAEVRALSIPASQRVLIPNGVDTETFHPVPAGARQTLRQSLGLPDGLLAIYTGRLAPEKQIDQLLAIWPAVRAAVPQATLLILGAGTEETTLRQQAGDGVDIRGRVEEVAPYLQVSDLFVLPSKGEGLSNAMLEAMATGLPVVTTRVSGSVDLVRDGFNGRLVPEDNPTALKQAIVDLLSDGGVRARLGHEARVVVESGYSLETTCQRLCDLYDSVIQQKKVAPSRVLRSEP